MVLWREPVNTPKAVRQPQPQVNDLAKPCKASWLSYSRSLRRKSAVYLEFGGDFLKEGGTKCQQAYTTFTQSHQSTGSSATGYEAELFRVDPN